MPSNLTYLQIHNATDKDTSKQSRSSVIKKSTSPVLHLPRRKIRRHKIGTTELSRLSARVLSQLDLSLIADARTAGTASRTHTVGADSALDLVRSARARVLDRSQDPLAPTEQGHGRARPVAALVA